MTDLDLSFLEKKSEKIKAVEKETGDLDLSFVSKVPVGTPLPKAEKPADERSFGRKVGDFFTGNDRSTAQIESLPELQNSGILSTNKEAAAKLAPVLLTTTNPNEIAKIISETAPEVAVTYDKDGQGNVFPILTNRETGARSVINKPGISGIDVLQGLGLAAAFFPASRGAAGVGSAVKASANVGARSAATQTAIEGAQAVAGGDFNPGDIAIAGVGGALFEGVAQGIGRAWPAIKRQISSGQITEKIRDAFKAEAKIYGIPEEQVTDDIIRMWSEAPEAGKTGVEKEFNVTLTRGQRSGDQAALFEEDALRSGARGDRAQKEFLTREGAQNEQLLNAGSSVQGELAGSAPQVATRNEAGAAIREGIINAERSADSAITQAYSEVGSAALKPEGFRQLLRATRDATRSVDFAKANVPAYEALQKQIAQAERSLRNLGNRKGTELKPVHIRHIDDIRKGINSSIEAAANGADRRNLMAMKNAFDEQLDSSVIANMFEGDQAALESLKSARGVFRDYMQRFGENVQRGRLGQASDGTGSFIKKIVLENPTDEQVINSLWSATGFNRQASAKLAQRYKEILGPDSDEWNMVRQAAFRQILGETRGNGETFLSGAKTATNWEKARKQGQSLLNELFTADEQAKINRFVAVAKRTSPDLVKSRANPSGTAVFQSRETLKRIANTLSFADIGLAVASGGISLVKNVRNAGAAKDAFRPFEGIVKGAKTRTAESVATSQTPETYDAIRQLSQ